MRAVCVTYGDTYFVVVVGRLIHIIVTLCGKCLLPDGVNVALPLPTAALV